MRAGEVLDAQRNLIERMEGEPDFRDQVAYMWATQRGLVSANYPKIKDQTRMVRTALDAALPDVAQMARFGRAAYTYRVTHDMCMLVEHAAATLDETDLVDTSLAPTGCGFVRFDRPLPINDIRGKTMLIHWLVWGPAAIGEKGGTLAWVFNDPWSQPDEVIEANLEVIGQKIAGGDTSVRTPEEYLRLQGRFATIGAIGLVNGEPLGSRETLASERQAAEILADGFEPTPGTNGNRYLHALWLLLNQTITKVEDEYPDRPASRRAKKANLPPKVTVVALRRTEGSEREPGESLVEWSHRWIVRGHWRWQACGAGRSERRRIWINGYQKGPADKPLVVSEKVYQLER